MSDQLYETLKDTATKHIQAFESPHPFDADQIYSFRENCTMRFHPLNSMPAPFGENLPITRNEHDGALRLLADFLSKVKMDIQLMAVDVLQRTVTSWLQAHYDFKDTGGEPGEKDYMIEYVWITRHNEVGDKIVSMEEFLDVPRALHMIGKSQTYAEEHAKGD